MCAKDKRTATETFRCRCLSSRKKNQQNLTGVATTPPPPTLVRLRVNEVPSSLKGGFKFHLALSSSYNHLLRESADPEDLVARPRAVNTYVLPGEYVEWVKPKLKGL